VLLSEFSIYPKYVILSFAFLNEPSINPKLSIFIFVPLDRENEFKTSNSKI
jgi:hypothetical protein